MAAPRWLACSTKNARAWAVYESAAISSPAENEIIHLVNSKGKDIGPASHSVNVMVLSLLLGKAMCLSEEEMKCMGMGALLHDAGKSEVPQRILLADNRTKPKEDFYRGHVPAFNLADMAITAGAIGLILDELLRVRRGR